MTFKARELIPILPFASFLSQHDRILRSCSPGRRVNLRSYGGTIDSKLESLIKKYASIYKP